ncbi:hypothetical protein Mam01_39780 [Microbispora amethystogenes]|uniref:DUF3558 domain-containing protein n=1 Tax=Microbispora amethystogenes TaxID=1427754 RepID=A0ABQ4FG57_9ACTN|nr:hypothetical protein Mam01_39780 [Microbispora amethystogenes]
MIRKTLSAWAALALFLASTTGCSEKKHIDRTPMPTIAAPPYACDYIPLRPIEVMTGVRDPLIRGDFDLRRSSTGMGGCAIYQRTGDKLKVLYVDLSPGGELAEVEEHLRGGAKPLPEILPGGKGYYFKDSSSNTNSVYSMLVRDETRIMIQLEIGAEGRDNAADVVALMKLIAPKLITDASAASSSPSPSVSAKG